MTDFYQARRNRNFRMWGLFSELKAAKIRRFEKELFDAICATSVAPLAFMANFGSRRKNQIRGQNG